LIELIHKDNIAVTLFTLRYLEMVLETSSFLD